MQKTISYVFMTLAFLMTLSSCENELNVAAEWKEIPIVYGALNPNDDINYVRIQKAFLDEEQGAVAFSHLRDSLYYDTLVVTVSEFLNDNFIQEFTLKKVDGNDFGIPKDSGFFFSDENILYQLDQPIQTSNSVNKYRYDLRVENPFSGHVCTGSTVIVGSPEIQEPVTETQTFLQFSTTDNHTIRVKFQEGIWARAYSIAMDFRIEETRLDNGAKEIKELEWRMINSAKTDRIQGFGTGEYFVPSISFFALLDAQLTADPNIERRVVDFDMNFYGIADDFNTYLNVNRPSIGIIQNKPEYTNMTNALGLFSSRHIESFKNVPFHGTTTGVLNLSELTSDLGFVQ